MKYGASPLGHVCMHMCVYMCVCVPVHVCMCVCALFGGGSRRTLPHLVIA